MKSNIFTIVACLVYVDGKILLLKRHPKKSQGGLWALPAGKIEEGESEAEAIVRELAEETGIKVDGSELVYQDRYHLNAKKADEYAVVVYRLDLARSPAIALDSKEHVDKVWKQPSEIIAMKNAIADMDVLLSTLL
jgi:mutator protein MutT